MRWIIGTSMRLHYLVIVIAVVLILFGAVQIQELPIDVYPEFNPPLVEIQTEALGLSSQEMESLITVPLEADLLNGIAWLDQIYSETVAGLSSILLVFEPGTDPIRARQMVQERLTQTFALPNVSKPPTMLQPLSASNRVMIVSLKAEDMPLIDMSVLAHWVIAPRLTGVPGVANVAVWGHREWQLQVQIDPKQLSDNGVSLQQIITTTGETMWVSPLSYLESSTPGTSGWIDTPNQRLGIQHILPISAAADLAKIPVAGSDGILLGDVTTVVEDHQILIGDALLNDGPGLLLVIEKFPNANILDVTTGIEKALKALEPGMGGIEYDSTIFRSANYIDLVVTNLSGIAVASIILILISLVAFSFGWRTPIITSIAIVASLVSATFIIFLSGMTLNIMTLAGLIMAITIVVHNSVVDVDHIVRGLKQHDDGSMDKSAPTIITNAMVEMRGPLGYAFIIILLTILPVFFIDGLAGAFFEPFAVSYIIALVTSLVVALVVTPALSLALLPNVSSSDMDSPLVSSLKDIYSKILGSMINNTNAALIASGVLVIAGVASLVVLQLSLMPSLKQPDLRIQLISAPSTSREAMLRVTNLASTELQAIPGVLNVGSHIGRAITGDQIVGVNSGEIWVSLDPAANYDETQAAIQDVINGYPGLLSQIDSYEPSRLKDILAESEQDITLRLFGHELNALEDLSQTVMDNISTVDGLTNMRVEPIIQEPQIEIQVKLDAAEQYQIKPGDVRRAASTLLSGLTVGHLYEEQKVFEVVVWGAPELRNSLSDIENLLIDTPTGQVRLAELANINIKPVPTTIKRNAVQRFIDIHADIDGRDFDSVSADIKQVIQSLEFPLEYHAEIVKDLQQSSQTSLPLLIIAVIIGIFLLIQAAYASWRIAIVAFLTLPVALTGGVIATLLTGGIFSIGSLFGLVASLGLAVRLTILTVSYIQRRIQDGNEPFGPDLIIQTLRDRVASIMTTLVTIAVALIPIAFSGNIAGTEVLYPMVMVILGALISTAIHTMFILPALYLRFGASDSNNVSSVSS